MNKVSPLQTGRFYKVKNPRKHFLCALCSAPRSMKYSKHLSAKNYLQIIILSAFISWVGFPLMGVKSFLLLFPVWMLIEIANKILYRKEVACPYCGFDATWYRRDVKVANKIVKEFWKENYPELLEPNTESSSEVKDTGTAGTKSSAASSSEAHV